MSHRWMRSHKAQVMGDSWAEDLWIGLGVCGPVGMEFWAMAYNNYGVLTLDNDRNA